MSQNTEVLCTPSLEKSIRLPSLLLLLLLLFWVFFATGNHLIGDLLPPFGLECGVEKNGDFLHIGASTYEFNSFQ